MKFLHLRWPVAVLLVTMAIASGCAVSDGGYGGNVGIGVGYYEPFGSDYGGWGQGYNVGPFRGGGHRDGGSDRRGGGSTQHAFRSAPASHSMPSIPTRGGARGGGGGGRAGGGHTR